MVYEINILGLLAAPPFRITSSANKDVTARRRFFILRITSKALSDLKTPPNNSWKK